MSFVERHGLWSDEQKEAASRLRRIVEEQKLEVDPAVVSRPARHPARQDAGRERSAGLAGERLLHHHHHARQGHLAPHGVSGVHRRRRFRHAGDGGRRRRPDGAGSDHVPRAAVGAGDRLAAVRPLFRRRPAGAVRDPPALPLGARTSSASAATISSPASKSNSTSSSSKTRRMAPEDAGQPGTAAVGQPAVARLSISDRAALRPDGAGARNHPARRAGARPAVALGRGRVRPEPVRIHLPADDGPRRPPTTWCCSAAP